MKIKLMQNNKLLTFWLLYPIISWLYICIIKFNNYTLNWIVYLIIFIGIIFIIWKLYNFNNINSLKELNFLTLIYDFIFYIYFIIIGITIWCFIYIIFQKYFLNYYILFFPEDQIFYSLARRIIFVGSSINISLLIYIGEINKMYKIFQFTNKVRVLEILFVIISLFWVIINIDFLSMFISSVIIITMPLKIKQKIVLFINKIKKNKLDINKLEEISNYSDNDVYMKTTKHFFGNILMLIIIPLISGLQIQVPLAFITLILGMLSIIINQI